VRGLSYCFNLYSSQLDGFAALSSTVNIVVLGSVNSEFLDLVRSTLAEFYSKLGADVYVEVYVYSSKYLKRAVIEELASAHGVSVIGEYVVMHEAWSGLPRIHVDAESCNNIEERYVRALLVHEAAHALLHGTLLSYLLRIPGDRAGKPASFAGVYVASTIVKDMQVHKFLVNSGFVDEVVAYAEYVSKYQLSDACSSFLEVLELAKILTPCIYLESCVIIDRLENCRELALKILEELKPVEAEIEKRDLSESTLLVLHTLENTVASTQRE